MKLKLNKCFFLKKWKWIINLVLYLTVLSVSTTGIFAAPEGQSYENFLSANQNLTITGTITDENGHGLPGVNVTVKETTTGTVTDYHGNFSIVVSSEESVLVFSFMGYLSEEVTVGTKTVINLSMIPDVQSLDEVVVIGYGTLKRNDLTGAVASVNSGDFAEQKSTNITEVLKGKMAGVEVSNLSGAPGGDVKIRVRGPNSIRTSNEPAIVVDGMIMNINLSDINVNDIETIDVLKDASASAIYGSKGANGVILITTKKGISAKPTVEYNTFMSINQLAKKMDLLNAAEFATLVDSVRHNEIYTSAEIDSFRRYGGTDWQDMIFRKARTQSHQLSISGGNEKTNYMLSANYVDDQGIVINTYQHKIALRSNISTKVNDKFNVMFNTYMIRKNTHNVNDNGSKGGIVNQSLMWSPTEPVWDDEASGQYNRDEAHKTNGSIHANPYMVAMEKVNDVVSSSAVINMKLSYEIIRGLTFDIFAGTDYNNTKDYNFYNQWINESQQGSDRQDREWLGWQNSNQITYNANISELHKLTLTGVFELRELKYNQFSASGSGLTSTGVGYYNLGLNTNQGISSDYSKESQLSYFGRAFYSYHDIVLFTGTYRIDNSSKFPEKYKSHAFPSLALGIRLSEMSFLKNNSVISNLKIRGGWGITGFDDLPPYQSITLLEEVVYSFGTATALTGLTPQPGKDPTLDWEKIEQVNGGVDLAVLDNRLAFTVDFYKKNTRDLLEEVVIPGYNGGGTVYQNIGEIQNKGLEMGIDLVPYKTADLSWEVNINFSTLKNTILKLNSDSLLIERPDIVSGIIEEDPSILIEGQSMGNIYGYKYLGPWKSDEADLAAEYRALPGMRKFEDVTGDSTINSNDIQVIGNSLPKFIWGAYTTFKYKMFTLNIMFQGLQGADKLNVSYAQAASINSEHNAITHRDALDYWTTDNENTMWSNPTITRPTVSSLVTSQWVQDASYVKIKNISLSCNIPRNLIKVADLKISASLQNWITFTKYKGFDPEVTSTGNNDVMPGIDIGSYPSPKSIVLGATLTF